MINTADMRWGRPPSESVNEIVYGKDQRHKPHRPGEKYSIWGGLLGSIIGLIIGVRQVIHSDTL